MVPHSVVTVSLATAVLPRMSALAAEGDHAELARTLVLALRNALVVIVPFALLLPLVSRDVSHVIWGYGAGSDSYANFAPSLALFGFGLVFFTIHYVMLRGFYALEQTRTVFLIQCVIAVVNVTAALLLVREATAAQTSPGAGRRLRHGLPRGRGRLLDGPGPPAARLRRRPAGAGRLRGAAARGRAARRRGGVRSWGCCCATPSGPTRASASPLLRAVAVTGVDVVAFVLLARLARLREVTAVLDLVARRGSSREPRRGRPTMTRMRRTRRGGP